MIEHLNKAFHNIQL